MTTLVLTFSGLLVLSSLYMLIPVINQLSIDLQSPSYLTAYVNTAFSLSYAIGFLFIGQLSEKYGTKRTIVCGMLLLAAVTFIAGFSRSIETLIASRALQGVIATSFAPAALTYIADNYPPETRIIATSWLTTGFIAAGIIGQVISSALERLWGWEAVFWAFALAYFILSLLNGRILLSGTPETPVGSANITITLTRLGRNISLVKAYAVAFTLLLSFVALYSSLDHYLKTDFRLNPEEIFNIRAIGIMGIAGAFFVPRLAIKTSFAKIVALGILIMIISLLCSIVTASITFITLSLVLFVAGLLITIPGIISLVAQLAGNDKAMALTWYSFILFIGAAVGPLIAKGGDFGFVIGILVTILSIALGTVLTIKF